jgi:type I restriction enzyme S subunit
VSKERNKERWHTFTLPDLAENLDRRRVPLTKADRTSGPYPYYGASGIVDYVEGYLFEGDTLLISEDGANLLARSTPIAFPATGKYWVNNHAHILRFHNGVTQRLVELYLESVRLDSYITGAAQPKLNQSALNSIPITIPVSPQEQERLVNILDEALEGVDRANAASSLNLGNSRALMDGALQSLLERNTQAAHVCLDSVCEISSMLIDPRETLYVDLPHVGAGNIESRTGVLRDVKTAREEGLISGKFVFDETMVLYSKIRPYLEKVTRPDFRGLCSADMYPLKPSQSRITRDFLFYILLSRHFTQYAIAGSARTGMPKVNRDHLFKYRFRLPSVTEQNHITEKLDSLRSETDRLDGIYKQKQLNLEDLKQSLLQQAFSGNL